MDIRLKGNLLKQLIKMKNNYTLSGDTNLPMSWGVKNDNSSRFKYLVIYFLHKKYGCYSFRNLIEDAYYGIKKDRSNGASESPEVFDVILTLDEFEKMIKKK